MHLTAIGRVLKLPDIDHMTAHGTLDGLVEAWHKLELLSDPNVDALLALHPVQDRAAKGAARVVNKAFVLMREAFANLEVLFRWVSKGTPMISI